MKSEKWEMERNERLKMEWKMKNEKGKRLEAEGKKGTV
jgi:hypothetical protein